MMDDANVDENLDEIMLGALTKCYSDLSAMDSSPITDIYQTMMDTAETAGFKVISDDKCCKLLAVLWTFGSEEFTKGKLHVDIAIAQRRVNLFGGEMADLELSQVMNDRIKEIAHKPYGYKYPDWLHEIAKEYNIYIVELQQ